ncbi:2-succinyl-5-enolpyruvyl-6-hydroxy-3-cyclohexen e-1-carboxylic-acid synthase [Formosa agariphila KMM 3901]|uniref:2-succinyl-5-enolpyruvyl-6-hydroxy-3-cyclohexene-1-carboxylate synthase n=1 Tax=Formosa agariphila (strain DSM 15362 / KCTC 12365 / LMG 23005 / KMM 3901 / M-2Alg 35-1) TaxID=1347342 RepID=T2KJ56_FORAG|nr:2-succinyl-5-enolpyruvyl-6-hydroxy-3-cyclohexene-1-carboxylate synthase [Formosa agariphila]CDF78917.1 2-succinyl-5-enolpyruvyl-6-hydroxy-3-cyclohexen e-1-carboxylic-acid synthase [Formosa agariphila KMM 3901]
MIYSAIPLAQTVIQLCKAKQIKHIVISPGSRNAPLTIGFTHDPFFTCYSIVDERCAAFFALGIAQQLKKPVAVACTSGSALLNYYPAISEAFYSNIPLVVLSADRPKHMIGIGDGQTINQPNVFKNHILYSANLKLDVKEEHNRFSSEPFPVFKTLEHKLEHVLNLQNHAQNSNETEINSALNIAKAQQGPVHINIPFDEPLYNRVETLSVNPEVIAIEEESLELDFETIEFCADDWNAAERKLVLVGVNGPNEIEQKYLDVLAEDDSVIVLTETTSNVHHEAFFPSIDKLITPLTEGEFKALQPDILLTIGGLIVSKRVKAFLRTYKPKQHWHVGQTKANDTFFSLNKHIKTTPNQFLSQLTIRITVVESDYKTYWNRVKEYRELKHDAYLADMLYSDFKVFDVLIKTLRPKSVLQLGNSSTIRYAQLFNLPADVEVFCNRGTSGIDGSTSTAIGCAVVTPKPTTLISGDLSFLYDSNALWNNYIPSNFRIIVINNEGGGIFRILPGHKNTENFDCFFETKHHLTAKHLAEMYKFEYQSASNEYELVSELNTFYSESKSPKLLEIFTPSTINDSILIDYFKALK